MKNIFESHRALLVLMVAGGSTLATLFLGPYEKGVPVGWLAALALIVTLVAVMVMAIFSTAIGPPSTHQALGGLMILTGLMLITL